MPKTPACCTDVSSPPPFEGLGRFASRVSQIVSVQCDTFVVARPRLETVYCTAIVLASNDWSGAATSWVTKSAGGNGVTLMGAVMKLLSPLGTSLTARSELVKTIR